MITPASPAPEDTPTICGSARGFFITACKIAPDTARQAPLTQLQYCEAIEYSK